MRRGMGRRDIPEEEAASVVSDGRKSWKLDEKKENQPG